MNIIASAILPLLTFGLGVYITNSFYKFAIKHAMREYETHLVEAHDASNDPNQMDMIAAESQAFENFKVWAEKKARMHR